MWQLSGTTADWNSPPLAARVDLLAPGVGLQNLCIDSVPLPGASLLCLRTPEQDSAETLVDVYVRQDDLVATYAQTAARPVRPQIYWRGLPAAAGRLGGCELIVSAQTSLLGVDPALSITSLLPTSNVRRLCDEQAAHFEPFNPSVGIVAVDSGPGAFLIRAPNAAWSYLELIYPSDFARATLAWDAASQRAVRLTSFLFPESLEKGVIRRARIRGLFLPRSGDEAAALAAYREFVDSPLPLTT